MKKHLLILGILTLSLFSCKQCLECKYGTLKGTIVEKFCSSTKQDRIDFELQMTEEAEQNNSKAICTKEKY